MIVFKLKDKKIEICNGCIALKKVFGKNNEFCQLGWKINIDNWCCEHPENEEDIERIFQERYETEMMQIYGDDLY